MTSILVLLVAVMIAVSATTTNAAVKTEDVEYKDGDVVLQGIMAYDDKFKGPRPVVVVGHEWWGINDYISGRVKQLAEMGYFAFAADIYGKGVRPKTMQEAQTESGKFRGKTDLIRSRMNIALQTALKNPMADKNKIAAIGFCFGGGAVIELAESGAPLLGTVSFHGSLPTHNPADAKNIKGRVLVLHGGSDPAVNLDVVNTFEKQLKDAGVMWQTVIYGDAVHAFTNPNAGNDPSKGSAYNAEAAKKSWEEMKEFLAEVFK
jgi:dienelactone hydrolase